jgi:hypothetical protein
MALPTLTARIDGSLEARKEPNNKINSCSKLKPFRRCLEGTRVYGHKEVSLKAMKKKRRLGGNEQRHC